MNYKLKQSQRNAVKSLDKATRCILDMTLRSGKTLAALHYLKKKKYKSILWSTPYTDLINSLQDEMKKFNIDLNIKAICHRSLAKEDFREYSAIVLDEIHLVSLKQLETLSRVHPKTKMIGMTGTIPRERSNKYKLLDKLGFIITYTYQLEDAVEDNNVSDYNITVYRIPLDTAKNIHVKTDKYNFYTSEQASYNSITNKLLDEHIYGEKEKRLRLLRLSLLNGLQYKLEYVKQYIQTMEARNKRVLVFVDTKKNAERVSKQCYYSGKDDTYFQLFKDEKINHLVLVNKGSVGQTYHNLDGCLVGAVNSSNDILQQKMFRTILFRENHVANIGILISKDTIQENWLSQSLRGINLDKVTYKNISVNEENKS